MKLAMGPRRRSNLLIGGPRVGNVGEKGSNIGLTVGSNCL